MAHLADRRILVTGGGGFLGRHVVRTLRERGCTEIVVPRRERYDLTREAAVEALYRDARPQVVIHLAAVSGGIGASLAFPGRLLYDNLVMGALVMEHARRAGAEKLVAVAAPCVYPAFAEVPFREEDLWSGYPDGVQAPYALAKRMLVAQAQAYRRQYGLNAVTLVPAGLYGPGDQDDLETSHVVPALVRKCIEAREAGLPEVVCWGDGSQTRELLYVEDGAEAVVAAAERYDEPEPVNIGAGSEVSIRDLAALVAELTGFRGRLVWDASRPGGQRRRRMDVSRAERELGFRASVGLRQGLARTIAWYERAATRSRLALLLDAEAHADRARRLARPQGVA